MLTRRAVLGAGLGAGILATGCTNSSQSPASVSNTASWNGTYLADPGAALPNVELTDHNGKPYNLATGPTTQAVALFFGYTNCPDVCPGIMADMATAKRRLSPDLIDDITLIVVTTDPARDTPAVLKDYLARVDPSFIGLSGSLEKIVPAARTVGIDIAAGKKLPTGGYEVDHGTYVLGFGAQRRLRVVWNAVAPKGLREDYQRLIELS